VAGQAQDEAFTSAVPLIRQATSVSRLQVAVLEKATAKSRASLASIATELAKVALSPLTFCIAYGHHLELNGWGGVEWSPEDRVIWG
jgi:hypothetical protein